MKPSTHDGQPVTYVDHNLIAHTGVIVGQSDDGKLLYVRSTRKGVKPASWHFTITPAIMPAVVGK